MRGTSFIGLVCCSLLFNASCLLDQLGTAAADADSDSDIDSDMDDGIDADDDPDVDPDIDDADPDGGDDADPDVVEELQILSVEPAFGFTCGWFEDPRPRAQKDVTIRFADLDEGETIELVRLGETEIRDRCIYSTDEGCYTTQYTLGDGVGELILHYPGLRVEGELELSIHSATESAVSDQPFVYQLLDLGFDVDSPVAAGAGGVSALLSGCFRDPRGEGFNCDPGGRDVVLTLGQENEEGHLRLVHAIDDEEIQAFTLTRWSGEGTEGVAAMAPVYAGRSSRSSSPPDVVTLGTKGLRIHRYDRESGSFGHLPLYNCNVFLEIAGVSAGDFDQTKTGEEVLVISWRDGPDELWVRVFPTTVSERFCLFTPGRLAISLPVTIPAAGEPDRVLPAIADLDGDGRLDIALALLDGEGSPQLYIFWGDGNGSVEGEPLVLPLPPECGRPGRAVAVDVEGDEDPDLIASCGGAETIELAINEGGRSFEEPISVATGLSDDGGAALLAAGHLDPDDIPDLVVGSHGTGRISVLRGRGTRDVAELWTGPRPLPVLPVEAQAVLLEDLDDNGYADIVVAGSSESDGVVLVVWTNADLN